MKFAFELDVKFISSVSLVPSSVSDIFHNILPHMQAGRAHTHTHTRLFD